jgi:cellobiose phosphorylase
MEPVTFLEADPLKEDQVEAYIQPKASSESGTILEHCARAIDRSLELGAHGLPLMGSGDWNDGMNRVGWKGKGESVWLGWFLCTVLEGFEPLLSEPAVAVSEPGAVMTGSEAQFEQRRATYAVHLEKLRKGLEKPGTVIGTAGRILMMGHRSGRPKMMSAGSTRSRRRGLSSLMLLNRTARNARWPPLNNI